MSTLGAAIVAGDGAGVFKDIESVTTRFSKPNVIIEPVMGEEKKYKKYIRIYEDLFSALKETYRKLSVEGE
jgi:xylulokinase